MASPEQDPPDEILFVGDVHLGRRPVGLDSVLDELGLARHLLSPAAALRNLVDEALGRPPRAVVFAGDLVDQEEDRFEAYSILEREVTRLRKAAIPVLAVAGNHDGQVLPRLVERVKGVELLGTGGTWERHELAGSGRPVDLFGWSFPRPHFTTCPLEDPSFATVLSERRAGATALGLLHCDLGASSSNYAPVSRARLEQTGFDGWFLGHVHAPGELTGARPVGYLGSLTGLHSNEVGPRGPWRVQLTGTGVRAEQVPLAPVRWEALELALDDSQAEDVEAVHTRIEAAVKEQLGADPSLLDERLRLIVARVKLTGRLSDPRAVRKFSSTHRPEDTLFRLGGVPVIVEQVRDETRVRADLEALAREPTAIGQVAGRLLELAQGRAGAALADARRTIAEVREGGWNVDDELHPLPGDEQLLERAAWAVLDSLLEQRQPQAGRA